MLATVIFTIMSGILGGLIHSLLFLYQKSRLARFVHMEQCVDRTRKIIFVSSVLTFVRMGLFGSFLICLLLSSSIHPILLVLSFLLTFWLVILNNKATFYEQL